MALRLIDAAIFRLFKAREAVVPPPEPEPPPPPPPSRGEEGGPPGYGDLWLPTTEAEAMDAILNTQDAEAFDASGRLEAETVLAPLMGKGDVVMDLGCGIGRVARHAAPHCRALYAVDASEAMLAMARERLADRPNVRYAVCRGTTLPDLGSATLDMAYSLLTLQHLEREDAFLLLREICRVVRPGGTVYLTFPNLLSETYFSGFVAYAEEGEVSNPVRARLYTPQEVEWILPAAGLEALKVEVGTEIRVRARSGGAGAAGYTPTRS